MKKKFETLKKAFLRAGKTAKSHSSDILANEERRKFLKLVAFGGGTLLVGRFLGNMYEHFSSDPSKVVFFRNFKVTESNKELGVYDLSGDEILIIDKQE